MHLAIKKSYQLLVLFLLINFGGLALGSFLMNSGPTSDWYMGLNKAPWTPPGWVFGAVWTTIMICFSIYLSKLFVVDDTKNQRLIYGGQVFLNVIWNYIFFNQHQVLLALIVIVLLTSLIFIYFFKLSYKVQMAKYLLVPYMIWLCIATSLNLYVLIHN